MADRASDDSLITGSQAAEILGISLRTLERMRADGTVEAVYLPTAGRATLRRFRRADIEARREAAALAKASS